MKSKVGRGRATDPGSIDWRTHMRTYERSGLSQREYCEAKGLGIWRFIRERSLYLKQNGGRRRRRGSASHPVEFVSLRELIGGSSSGPGGDVDRATVEASPSRRGAGVALVVSGRYRLEFDDGFSAETLHRVLETLERRG